MCKALITVSMCTFESKCCQSTWRWGFSEEFCMKGSHTLRSVCCASTCAFLLACGSCGAEPTIWKRPALLKSLSAPSLLFFSPSTRPFFFHFFLSPLSGLQGLRTQAPKDYQTHPFQKHWAPLLLWQVTVYMCVWKRTFEHSRSHTFYPLCLLREKKVEEEKQKESWRVGWKGEADWVIAAHQHREGERARAQSFGPQPATATIQLLCGELT